MTTGKGGKCYGKAERQFGFVFASVFAAIGSITFWLGRDHFWLWLIPAATLSDLVAYAASWLAPLNQLWLHLGFLLHQLTSPIIMGFLFYATVMPIGLLMRAFGQDPLRLKRDPLACSYWIERRPPGPSPDTIK